jgi:hypothetical protein
MDYSAERMESILEIFVSSIYLMNVIYATGAISSQCGDEQRDARSDVR